MTWAPPPPPMPPGRTSGRKAWWQVPMLVAVTALGVAAVVGLFMVQPRVARIQGHGMSPTLRNDDRTIFIRRAGIARGDIVMLRYPKNPSKEFVMRIVGLPGERLAIADGRLSVDGRPIAEPYVADDHRSHETFGPVVLGPDEYFVMGDNRRNSSDSREWGPVSRELIGRRLYSVWYRFEK